MEWDRMKQRESGIDLNELSKNLVRAYVRKLGDSAIDPATVWEHPNPNMEHEINQHFEEMKR